MQVTAIQNTGDVMLALYRTMVRIRLCEESLIALIEDGQIKTPCHLYTGEEAIATGLCACLDKSDMVFSSHRSHGHFLAKGGSMNALVAEIYCREGGCSHGRGGSMHLTDPSTGMMGSAPIVAGTIPLALGAALASSIRNDGRVTVSFFGDGATGEGVLFESMNFAALRRLPIIFACENNFYSTHLPIRECRPSKSIYEIAQPFGIRSERLDGNDVLAVLQAGRKAVADCREGRGPVFLELLTYRMHGHVGPSDNIQGTKTDIRPQQEIEEWQKRDPIDRLERTMLTSGQATRLDLDRIKQKARAEVAEAHRAAAETMQPAEVDLLKDVYVQKP